MFEVEEARSEKKQRSKKALTQVFARGAIENMLERLKEDFPQCVGRKENTIGIMPAALLIFVTLSRAARLSGKKPEEFLRDDLGRVDPTYSKMPRVLVVLFRDSLAHIYQPASLELSLNGSSVLIGWVTGITFCAFAGGVASISLAGGLPFAIRPPSWGGDFSLRAPDNSAID